MKKAFTLIELLVVIAIIAILAGVVLSAVTTAKDKGAISAAIKSIEQVRVTAENNFTDGDTNKYVTGLCKKAEILAFTEKAADRLGYASTDVQNGADAGSAAATLATDGKITCTQSADRKYYMIMADIALDAGKVRLYCLDSSNGTKQYDMAVSAESTAATAAVGTFRCE